ncbi:rRNA maturation RNase YbeY [Patescibacteria group bacterium]|nr:rRNA maturation RNase YbeY [Patescibacteria group bacterium]
MEENFSLINKTKSKIPSLPFLAMKNTILGKDYSLSMAFVGKITSKQLNKKYRKKPKPTNVLSFSLSKNEGELVLCPEVMKKEAPSFERNYSEFVTFLVIHGMLHLKGYEHSSKMDRAEKLYCAKYDKKHFDRNRHRLSHDQSSRGRVSKRRRTS